MVVSSTCLHPHTLIFERRDFYRLLHTVQALLWCTADVVSFADPEQVELHYSLDSFGMIPDLVEDLGRGKIPFGYVYHPEA